MECINNKSTALPVAIERGLHMRDGFRCALSGLLVLSGIFFNAETGLPWGGSVHLAIAQNAQQALNQADFPGHYWATLIVWTKEPDKWNKVQNHLSASECAWRLKSLAMDCIQSIRNGEPWIEIMQALGKATHYIQDMNCPHHGIQRYIAVDHEAFEKRATYGFWDPEKFDGFQEIQDLKNFVWNAANFSERYIKFDNSQFYNDPERYEKVIEPLWTRTVNDVIDLWLTVFYQGLGEERYNEMGFPKKTGARDSKELDYPDVQLAND
jgi:hypothetical protein